MYRVTLVMAKEKETRYVTCFGMRNVLTFEPHRVNVAGETRCCRPQPPGFGRPSPRFHTKRVADV